LDGSGKVLNSADSSLSGTININTSISSVPVGGIITETYAAMSYTRTINTSTGVETYTYDNGVIISLDATKKIYTYTYPSIWPWSKIPKTVETLKIDNTNSPTVTITLTLTTDEISFDVISGVPQNFSGGTWANPNNIYDSEISVSSNSITKTIIYTKLDGSNFLLKYNSYDAGNAAASKVHI
jgi:hypothetical protein